MQAIKCAIPKAAARAGQEDKSPSPAAWRRWPGLSLRGLPKGAAAAAVIPWHVDPARLRAAAVAAAAAAAAAAVLENREDMIASATEAGDTMEVEENPAEMQAEAEAEAPAEAKAPMDVEAEAPAKAEVEAPAEAEAASAAASEGVPSATAGAAQRDGDCASHDGGVAAEAGDTSGGSQQQ